jgi:hypothetical protein
LTVSDQGSGWQWMPDRLDSRLQKSFKSRFALRPSVSPEGWPSIAEPAPSVTFDLSATFLRARPAIDEADELILRVLVKAFRKDERLIAMDFNHFTWWFWPHEFAAADRTWPDSWFVHPFPNGDYMIFMTEDMSCGTFGHPWEQTLCVFGPRVIEAARGLGEYWPVKRSRGGRGQRSG